MLRRSVIELYREKCNCGWNIRHNNGGNYHTIHKLHLIEGEDGVYCVIIEDTDTRESFPGDQYEVLTFNGGEFRLEDEDWVEEHEIVRVEGYEVRFRQGEAEILYQNPSAFIEASTQQG